MTWEIRSDRQAGTQGRQTSHCPVVTEPDPELRCWADGDPCIAATGPNVVRSQCMKRWAPDVWVYAWATRRSCSVGEATKRVYLCWWSRDGELLREDVLGDVGVIPLPEDPAEWPPGATHASWRVEVDRA